MQSRWFSASSNPGRHSHATPPLGVSLQIWAQPWSLFIQFIPSAKRKTVTKTERNLSYSRVIFPLQTLLWQAPGDERVILMSGVNYFNVPATGPFFTHRTTLTPADPWKHTQRLSLYGQHAQKTSTLLFSSFIFPYFILRLQNLSSCFTHRNNSPTNEYSVIIYLLSNPCDFISSREDKNRNYEEHTGWFFSKQLLAF